MTDIVIVDTQDDISQAVYAAEPGFNSVHITKLINGKIEIEFTYDKD